jgi:flagellar motor switch protein FliG
MLIGKDEAAEVMRHLAPEEVEAIAAEIAGIRRIEPGEARKILEEFGFLRETSRLGAGGMDTARRILVGAFGEEKGRDILSRSAPREEDKFFGFLEDFEARQIHLLLKNESPAVLAVILPSLKPETVSQVLPLFEAKFRTEVVMRMAKKEKVSREVLLRVEEALREKARSSAAPAAANDIDGRGILAEILKYAAPRDEEKILKTLEEENPLVAGEIKEKLFTIDVLEYMDDSGLQKVFRDMNDHEIALLLKGKKDAIRAKILSSVSERRRLLVAEEYRYLGAVPKKDADNATRDFLSTLKRLEAEGEIAFHRENEVWVE